jgi:hypothetical protein
MIKSDKLRDNKICRTRKYIDDFYECLVTPICRLSCGQSMNFGSKHYCTHPDRFKLADLVIDNQD